MRAFRRLRSWPCWLALLLLSGCMFHRLGRDLAQAREHAVLSGMVVPTPGRPADPGSRVLGDTGHERLVDYFVMAGRAGTTSSSPPGPIVSPRSSTSTATSPTSRVPTRRRCCTPVSRCGWPARNARRTRHRGPRRQRRAHPLRLLGRQRRGSRRGLPVRPPLRRHGDAHRRPAVLGRDAHRGLWQPVEFVRQVGAGVYFSSPTTR